MSRLRIRIVCTTIGALFCAGAFVLTAGCAAAPIGAGEPPMRFTLAPSASDIEPGATVTIVPLRENFPEQEAQIAWSSSGGAIETFDDEKIAQVTFDQPGRYSVIARVLVDGEEIIRDTIRFRVEASSAKSNSASASAADAAPS